MTIQEAINHANEVAKINRTRTKHKALHNNDKDEINACLQCAEEHEQLAEWLEEIQQYRAIGTVEEIKKVVRFLSMDNDNGIIEDLQLLNQYQLIGTVEECREAMEKQKEMKTGEPYMNGYGNTKAECLNCHCTVMYPSNYCKFCGQKLDWSEVN